MDAGDPTDECGMLARKGHLRQYEQRLTVVHAPTASPFAEIATRSMRELGSLAQLDGPEDEWLAPATGIPLFHSFWGRDELTPAWQATVFDRGEMAEAVLNRVGRLQGARDDPWRDEQPGRTVRANQRGPRPSLNITLATGIVNDEHLPRLVRRLFASDIFSGCGIRTLSCRNPAYKPGTRAYFQFWFRRCLGLCLLARWN
jgi:glycogen debranching enzyme